MPAIDQRRVIAGFLDNSHTWESMLHLNPKPKFIRLNQVHGSTIHTVTEQNLETLLKTSPEGDGLVTKLINVALSVHTADCLPIVAVDLEHGVIGMLHAGWKGLEKQAPIEFLKALVAHGAHTKSLIFSVGPHIQSCHFEVGKDVAEKLKAAAGTKLSTPPKHPDPNKEYFILRDLLAAQLGTFNIKRNQITVNNACTYCDKKYHSFRRDKGSKGRNESFIYLKPPLI